MKTTNELLSVEEATRLIKGNNILVLAGEESLLKQLPKGKWIGGTIPYFMSKNGGCFSQDKIFVNDITDYVEQITIKSYSENQLSNLIGDRYEDGFTYVLIPGMSNIHSKYAMEAESLRGIFEVPTIGWISGIDLAELGKQSPKTFDGSAGAVFDNNIVALHVRNKKPLVPRLEIINIFEQGDGDILTVKEDGFSFKECFVNGKKSDFVEYIEKNSIDTKLPLVASYSGANINVSFQSVDEKNGKVDFYAPLRKGVDYKLAKPVANYVSEFENSIPDESNDIVASCNCILNYLYSELEGKKTGNMRGPFTFGEIAYVLVNQTMVYLSLE